MEADELDEDAEGDGGEQEGESNHDDPGEEGA
jgi:hypothetical protein